MLGLPRVGGFDVEMGVTIDWPRGLSLYREKVKRLAIFGLFLPVSGAFCGEVIDPRGLSRLLKMDVIPLGVSCDRFSTALSLIELARCGGASTSRGDMLPLWGDTLRFIELAR
jgi:hypothetical protein